MISTSRTSRCPDVIHARPYGGSVMARTTGRSAPRHDNDRPGGREVVRLTDDSSRTVNDGGPGRSFDERRPASAGFRRCAVLPPDTCACLVPYGRTRRENRQRARASGFGSLFGIPMQSLLSRSLNRKSRKGNEGHEGCRRDSSLPALDLRQLQIIEKAFAAVLHALRSLPALPVAASGNRLPRGIQTTSTRPVYRELTPPVTLLELDVGSDGLRDPLALLGGGVTDDLAGDPEDE